MYRERFRGVEKRSGLTYLEMACDCGLKFDRWMKSENVETIEEMRNVVLMEHFMDQVSPAIKYELISLGVRDIMEAGRRADNYCQAHGIKWMIPQVGRNHASTGETADPLSKLTSDLHTNLDLQNLITANHCTTMTQGLQRRETGKVVLPTTRRTMTLVVRIQ